jgi:hypothetical protein
MSIDYGCDSKFLGAYLNKTDIIALYIINEYGKYFVFAPTPISINNLIAYDSLKERAQILLNSKYGYLKSENNTEKLKIYYQVYYNNLGDVDRVRFIGFYPEINNIEEIAAIEEDLLDIVNHYPKVKPAKLININVAFATYDFVEF